MIIIIRINNRCQSHSMRNRSKDSLKRGHNITKWKDGWEKMRWDESSSRSRQNMTMRDVKTQTTPAVGRGSQAAED